MQLFSLYFMTFLLTMGLFSCNSNKEKKHEIKSTDGLRIVSLVPSITKQFYLLSVEDLVVGHTSYCPDRGLQNSQEIGSAREVNVEKIVTLQPDVVFASSLISQNTMLTLKKLNIRVEYLPTPRSFEELCDQFIQIGKAVDKEDQARKLVYEQKRKIDSLQALIPEQGSPGIFFQLGANPLYAATSKSFVHDYIRFAKATNIAAGLKSGTISRESVIIKNPGVILIVTMGGAAEAEKKVWQQYPNLKAAQDNNIFIINAEEACSATPISFTRILEKIIGMLYDTLPSSEIERTGYLAMDTAEYASLRISSH